MTNIHSRNLCWLDCLFFMVCFERWRIVCHQNKYTLWWHSIPWNKFIQKDGWFKSLHPRRTQKITISLCQQVPFCQMPAAFKNQYDDIYIPSWINFLDEHMSTWSKKYYSGSIFIHWKPHTVIAMSIILLLMAAKANQWWGRSRVKK